MGWDAVSGEDETALVERARIHFRPANSWKMAMLHVSMFLFLLTKTIMSCRHVWKVPLVMARSLPATALGLLAVMPTPVMLLVGQ